MEQLSCAWRLKRMTGECVHGRSYLAVVRAASLQTNMEVSTRQDIECIFQVLPPSYGMSYELPEFAGFLHLRPLGVGSALAAIDAPAEI